MTVKSRVRAFNEELRDEGVPSLVVYEDEGYWHMAQSMGPRWKDFAAALRSLADQCDRMADGQRLN